MLRLMNKFPNATRILAIKGVTERSVQEPRLSSETRKHAPPMPRDVENEENVDEQQQGVMKINGAE